MSLTTDIKSAIDARRKVTLDFSQLDDAQAEEAIQAVNYSNYGQFYPDLQSARQGRKKAKIDFNQAEPTHPFAEPTKPGVLEETWKAATTPMDAVLDFQFPTIPYEGNQGVTTLRNAKDNLFEMGRQASAAVRTLLPEDPDMARVTGVPLPTENIAGAPGQFVDSQSPGMAQLFNVEAPAPQPQGGFLEAMASLTPNLLGEQIEFGASPLGLLTTPLPKAGLGPAAGVLGGLKTTTGIEEAARWTGKALSPVVAATSRAVDPWRQAFMQTPVGAAVDVGLNMFFPPGDVVQGMKAMRRNTYAELADILDNIGPRLTEELGPEASERVIRAMDEAVQYKQSQLDHMAGLVKSFDETLSTKQQANLLDIAVPTEASMTQNLGALSTNSISEFMAAATPAVRLDAAARRVNIFQEVFAQSLVDRGMFKTTQQAVQTMQEVAKASEVTRRTLLTQMPDQFRKAISREARQRGTKLLPETEQALVEEFTDRFERLRERYIASKGAAPETFLEYEGVMLPQVMDTGDDLVKGLHDPATSKRIGRERLHKRETVAETPIDVKSASFRVQKGLAQETFDVNLAEMFHKWSLNPDLASPLPVYPSWKQLKGKGFGALDGQYVHPGLWLEVDGMTRASNIIDQNIGEMMSMWKAGKVMHPPVISANILSSAMQNEAGGLSIFDLPAYRSAFRSMRNQDEVWKAARSTGLIGSTEMRTETWERSLTAALAGFERAKVGPEAVLDVANNLILNPKVQPKNIGHLYSSVEEFMKFAMFHKAYTQGLAEEGLMGGFAVDAARHADKWGLNSNDVPYGIRWMRSGLPAATIGSPFISYTWNVAPRLLEGMVTKPHKFVKYKIMLDAWNRSALDSLGMSEEEFADFQRMKSDVAEPLGGLMPDPFAGWMKELHAMAPWMVFPKRDRNGSPWVMSVGRLTPWGQMFNPRGMGFITGGPVADMALRMSTGKTLSGFPVVDEAAGDIEGQAPLNPSVGARKLASAAQVALPSFLTAGASLGAALAGPRYDIEGPTNTAGLIADLLGPVGGASNQGVPVEPGAAALGMLFQRPQPMNMDQLNRIKNMKERKKAKAYMEQRMKDARSRFLSGNMSLGD